MFGARFNHETRFFSDGYELSGVESASLNYTNPAQIVKPLGTKQGFTVANGLPQRTLSLSRVLTYDDPILSYTGDTSISGNIYYDDRVYGFSTGHLVDYNLNCAVGSVPRVSTNFQIASELKSGEGIITPTESHPVIDIPTQGSISITSDGSTTNRVIGFDYSIKCNRKAYTRVDSIDIVKVEQLLPIEFSATVQIDVDDAFMEDSHNFFSEKEGRNLQLLIDGRSGTQLQSLVIPNASLVGETLNASADGSLKLTLNYVGHTGSDATVLDPDLTYVFDSNGDVLDSTAANIPVSWMEASGDVYGVQFGNNVGIVNTEAFSGCSNLSGDLYIKFKDFGFGVGVVNNNAFRDCSGFNGNLIFDDDLITVGDNAFKNCNGFVGDLILNEASSILDSCFENCYGFESLVLPTVISAWGTASFKNCYGLKGALSIPSVDNVPSGSFENCSGLNSTLYIETGADFIGENAFKNCSKIIGTLKIQDEITGIKSGAFQNCHSLEGLDIGVGLTDIEHSAFKDCHEIDNVLNFPNGLDKIQNQAFMNCSALGGVNINSTITKIGDHAFSGCYGMGGSITIPSTVDFVETGVFQDCYGLNGSLTLQMTSGCLDNAFRNCRSLVGGLSFNNSVYNIGDYSFRDCSGLNESLTLPTSLSYLGDQAFYHCGFTGDLNISGCTSLTEIRQDVFRNVKFSNQLNLPESLTGISGSAFRNGDFTGLFVIPTGITGADSIKSNAFRGCTGIQDVYLDVPDQVFSESETAQFQGVGGCLYVTYRYYDDYVARLGNDNKFKGMPVCKGSYNTTVYDTGDFSLIQSTNGDVPNNWYKNQSSPDVFLDIGITCENIGISGFVNSSFKGDLIIPKSIDTIGLRAFDGCDGFDGVLQFAEGVEEIAQEAFDGCSGFAGDLILPNSLEKIGLHTFRNCTGFDGRLFIPPNLTGIGNGSFENLKNITGDVNIPSGITQINSDFLKNCEKLNSVKFHDGITGIFGSAFLNCFDLEQDLSLPSGLKQIAQSAFENCGKISSLKTNQNLETISNYAFRNCDGIGGSFNIPASVTSVGASAFKNCSGVDAIYSYAPESVFNDNPGTKSLQLQANTTSNKILYVTTGYYADYVAASNPSQYYHGNLIKKIRTNLNVTEYYDANDVVINSTSASEIPANWEDNDVSLKGTGSSVDFGNTVKKIGQEAFDKNPNLSGTIIFPFSLTGIDTYAFRDCLEVDAFVFNEGLKYINTQAFLGCDSLTSIKLPSTLQNVADYAFRYTDNLSSVVIGKETVDPITVLGENAMRGIGVNVTNGELTVNKSVSNVGRYCFYGDYDNWETVYLNCKTVGEQAFYSQPNITDLTFGPNVEVIGINNNNSTYGYTFRYCYGLTEVTIPNPKWISNRSFHSCNNIESIYVGNNTDNTNGTIGDSAFRYVGQSKIAQGYVWVGSSIRNINQNAFYGDYDWITGAYINSSSLGYRAFQEQRNLKSVTFGPNVGSLADQAFRLCNITGDILLTKDGVTIGEQTFGDGGTSTQNKIRNVYLNTNISNVDLTSGGSDNWANMTGAFYINNPSANGWTTGFGVGPDISGSTTPANIFEWTTYPNPI